jgi:carbonic anhydrase/acetyltransferase-like protein (isoleucine patch superfamily)
VLHTDPGFPVTLAAGASVGHQAMLHGCTVGERSLVGIQAVVLNGAVIGADCLVGACALVGEGRSFDTPGSLILGAPAAVKRALTPPQIAGLRRTGEIYAERARRYRRELVRVA